MITRAKPFSDTRAFGFSRIVRWMAALPRLSRLSVTVSSSCSRAAIFARMLLPVRDLDEDFVRQGFRSLKHGAANFQVGMIGEACQHLRRRKGGARQAVAQLRQRRAIDTGKEKAHHRIEKRDLIFGVQLRAVEKHIRDLTQNGGASVLRDLG
jgi:hypothetical protein